MPNEFIIKLSKQLNWPYFGSHNLLFKVVTVSGLQNILWEALWEISHRGNYKSLF